MSDDGTPYLEKDGKGTREDSTIADATLEAAQAGVVIHTFGLGEDSADAPGYLESIASETGGSFSPVTDLSRLHCQLAAALLP